MSSYMHADGPGRGGEWGLGGELGMCMDSPAQVHPECNSGLCLGAACLGRSEPSSLADMIQAGAGCRVIFY